MMQLLQSLFTNRPRYSFNPTMVRLLRDETKAKGVMKHEFQSHNGAIAALVKVMEQWNNREFQSHNGAIAAVTDQYVTGLAGLCFNPTMVRLLPLIYLDPPYVHETVSIPQWCDCCLMQLMLAAVCQRGFNPTMVRLLR